MRAYRVIFTGILLGGLIGGLSACTTPDAANTDACPSTPSPEARISTRPVAPAPLLFRHTVRLKIPAAGIEQTFDGIMRLDPKAHTVHAVGMGAFGIRLFDLLVTPDTVTVYSLHPSVAAITDHIAFSIRRLWLDAQPVSGIPVSGPASAPESAKKTAVYYGETKDGPRRYVYRHGMLHSVEACAPLENWSAVFGETDKASSWPKTISFTASDGQYALFIRTLDVKVTAP